jgi:DNA excision repair protein ERCC-5
MYSEVYLADDAEREMSLGRNAMIALAMLLGSDYTSGVKGIGIVNAMEVLHTFDVSDDLKGGLLRFRNWLDGFDSAELGLVPDANALSTDENLFYNKHRSARERWVPPDNFPADNIIHAYLNPVVDKSTDRFSWGVPDVEGLIEFCNRHIGWRSEETRRFLDPVVNKVQSAGYRQTRLDAYMTYQDSIKFADIRSNRLRSVLGMATHERAPSAKRRKKANEEGTNDEMKNDAQCGNA